MRSMTRLILLGGLVGVVSCGPSYRRAGFGVAAEYGAPIDVYGYYPDYFGDWRGNYQRWDPVVIYELRGNYYPQPVRGARAVAVYRSRSGYFLPPRDRAWSRTERRFDRRQMPNRRDYSRARRPRGRPGQ